MSAKRKLSMPSAYSVLFLIIILTAALTFLIPAGSYEYDDEGVPIVGSYSRTEQNAQGVGDVLLAPFEGLYDGIDVAGFILMVGGFLGVVTKTGAIEAGLSRIIARFRGRESRLILILMAFFALGGTTFGMAEETIAFYPLVIPVFIAAGYDALTGVAVILLGAGTGVLASTVNPFATGIASGFAGISLGSGLGLRLIILAAAVGISIWYVLRYAKRVKLDPKASLVYDMHDENAEHFSLSSGNEEMSGKQKIIMLLFALTFVIMIYSVIPFADLNIPLPTLGWWFGELSALFLVMAVLIGVVARFKETELINTFVAGCADLLGVAFIIGISRGITVIMNSGLITDTILNFGERSLSGMHASVFSVSMYLFYLPLSLLIPSTSGLATLSMPVLAPLCDFAGVGRELIVTAFSCASGLINLVTPTSAVVMGALAIGRVPYAKWLKFVSKLLLILLVGTAAALAIAAI